MRAVTANGWSTEHHTVLHGLLIAVNCVQVNAEILCKSDHPPTRADESSSERDAADVRIRELLQASLHLNASSELGATRHCVFAFTG